MGTQMKQWRRGRQSGDGELATHLLEVPAAKADHEIHSLLFWQFHCSENRKAVSWSSLPLKNLIGTRKSMGTLKIADHMFWNTNNGQGGYKQTYNLDPRETAQKDVGIAAQLGIHLSLLGFSHIPYLILSSLPFHDCPSPSLWHTSVRVHLTLPKYYCGALPHHRDNSKYGIDV